MSADFEINILAKSTGADATAAQVQELADKLTLTNQVSTQFDGAIAAATAQLTAAKAATAESVAALSAQEQKYAQLEKSANSAAKAAEKAAAGGKGSGDAEALQAAAASAKAALASEAAAVDAAKAKAEEAAAAEAKLAAALRTIEGAAKSAAIAQDKAAASAEKVAAAGSAAASKAAEAAAKEAKAAVVIEQGGDSLKALADSAKAGLGPMGGLFERLNLVKGAVAGGGGWTAAITLATVAVLAMTAAIAIGVAKLAVLAVTLNKTAMKKLETIGDTARKNFAKLFDGVHVEKFTSALDKVSGLLNENTSTANGLKTMISGLLNPLFDACTALAPIVSALFKGMVLGALMIAIGVVKVRNSLMAMIPAGVLSNIDWLSTAFAAGKVIMYAIGAVLVLLAGLFGVIAAAITIAITPLVALVAAVAAVGAGFVWLVTTAYQFVAGVLSAFASFASATSDVGASIVTGLIEGVTGRAADFLAACVNLAKGGINAIKSAIGFGSPAVEFIKIANIGMGGGLIEGARQAAPAVSSALETLAEPPDMQRSRSAGGAIAAAQGREASGATGGNSSRALSIGPNYFSGVDAEEAIAHMRKLILDYEEGLLASAGGMAPA